MQQYNNMALLKNSLSHSIKNATLNYHRQFSFIKFVNTS